MTVRPSSRLFSIVLLRKMGRAVWEATTPLRFPVITLPLIVGLALPPTAIPNPVFRKVLPRIVPLEFRSIDKPLPELVSNKFPSTRGTLEPLTNTPSRLEFTKVLLAIVGRADSTQAAVPRVSGLVAVTPRRWASSVNRKRTF